MTHWHAHNPWKDEVVYVPLVDLAHCVAGGILHQAGKNIDYTFEEVLKHWHQYGRTKLDGYILPSPSGDHSIGVRYGKKPDQYLSPNNAQPTLTAALLKRYQDWAGVGHHGKLASIQFNKGGHVGKHRYTGAKTYRSSSLGAGYGAGRAIEKERAAAFASLQAYAFFPIEDPKPKPIPHAGIRAGELIGYRLWWLINGKLCSLAHPHTWEPLATQRGDVDKSINGDRSALMAIMYPVIMGGVYAWANRLQRDAEAAAFMDSIQRCQLYKVQTGGMPLPRFGGWCPYEYTNTIVAGSIKMWGEVVEHQKGWRAQYAKVASIDCMYGDQETVSIFDLNKLYLGDA